MESLAWKQSFQVASHQKRTIWLSSQKGYSTILCKTPIHNSAAALTDEMESCTAKGNKPLVYEVVEGNWNDKIFRLVPALELQQLGVRLPKGSDFSFPNALGDMENQDESSLESNSYVDLVGIKDNGSIDMAGTVVVRKLEKNVLVGVAWTMIDGVNMVKSCFNTGIKFPETLEELGVYYKILNDMTECMWSLRDICKLLKLCRSNHHLESLIPPSYRLPFLGVGHVDSVCFSPSCTYTVAEIEAKFGSIETHGTRFDRSPNADTVELLTCNFQGFRQFLPEVLLGVHGNSDTHILMDYPGISNPILVQENLLTKCFGAINQTLSFIGENAQGFINSGLSMTVMIGFPVFQSNGAVLKTGLDYIRLGAGAFSTVFTIVSWIFSKSRKSMALANTTAGCALVSMLLGVFCAIFAPLALPYLSCFIIACMMIVLSAGYYASRP